MNLNLKRFGAAISVPDTEAGRRFLASVERERERMRRSTEELERIILGVDNGKRGD